MPIASNDHYLAKSKVTQREVDVKAAEEALEAAKQALKDAETGLKEAEEHAKSNAKLPPAAHKK